MKHSKKLLALVMAMMMAFSLMAMTAAAYDAEEHEHVCSEETIEPRDIAVACGYCARGMTEVRSNKPGSRAFQCMNETCRNFKITVYY